MEKELKTLKDLNKKVHKNWHPKNKLGAYNDEKCTEDNCSITDFEKELKAEAIKVLENNLKEYEEKINGKMTFVGKFEVKRFIDWFFNLTEEDLK